MLQANFVAAVAQLSLAGKDRKESIKAIQELAKQMGQDQNDVAYRNLLKTFAKQGERPV